MWLAGLAIFTSLIALYYYLQVIRQMYIESASPAVAAAPDDGHQAEDAVSIVEALPRPSLALMVVLGLGLLAVLGLGVYPAPLLEAIEAASQAILPGA